MKEFAELMFMNACLYVIQWIVQSFKGGLTDNKLKKNCKHWYFPANGPHLLKKRYCPYIKYTEGYVGVCAAAAAAPMMLKAHYWFSFNDGCPGAPTGRVGGLFGRSAGGHKEMSSILADQ